MLDPTQLRWSQFSLIDYGGQIIACGQLRNFEGAQELGSLVVVKDWRDRGIGWGAEVASALLSSATFD